MTTADRVSRNTHPAVNAHIRDALVGRLAYYATRPEKIPARLAELDREWDIERAIELNAAALMLAGTLIGVTRDRRWLALPAMVSGFLLQHAVQGWCPPVPVFRALGVRTADEINAERYALKLLMARPATAADAARLIDAPPPA
jgi:hypothetical protein